MAKTVPISVVLINKHGSKFCLGGKWHISVFVNIMAKSYQKVLLTKIETTCKLTPVQLNLCLSMQL